MGPRCARQAGESACPKITVTRQGLCYQWVTRQRDGVTAIPNFFRFVARNYPHLRVVRDTSRASEGERAVARRGIERCGHIVTLAISFIPEERSESRTGSTPSGLQSSETK